MVPQLQKPASFGSCGSGAVMGLVLPQGVKQLAWESNTRLQQSIRLECAQHCSTIYSTKCLKISDMTLIKYKDYYVHQLIQILSNSISTSNCNCFNLLVSTNNPLLYLPPLRVVTWQSFPWQKKQFKGKSLTATRDWCTRTSCELSRFQLGFFTSQSV